MATDCVFCKIAAGQIPSFGLLNEPGAFAFLDVHPLAPGHALLIPKRHYADIHEIPPQEWADLAIHLPRLAKAVIKATGAEGLNILQNNGACSGQAVFHLHIHLIPRVPGDRLGYRWDAGKYATGQAEQVQDRVRQALDGI